MNSLNTLLYGRNPKFKNTNGKFNPASLVGGRVSRATHTRAKPKRRMSAAARARIAEKLKARWAQVKAAGRKSL